jgi:gliding motility-associated-like protein
MNSCKIFTAVFFLLTLLIISACKKDKDPDPQSIPLTPEELFYTNCGKIPPGFACIKSARVFVPNAFTPNNDGYNDVFHPFVGYGIKEIISFKIFDESENLIYQTSNIQSNFINGPTYGWNGKLPDGSLQDGIYFYTLSISNTLGEIAEIEGGVCCRTGFPINCVENEKHIAWGRQHNGNGQFNSALPSREDCE